MREARREHHRDRHQRPARDEDEGEHEVLRPQAIDARVLAVAQEPPVGGLLPDPEAQPGEDDHAADRDQEHSSIA